MATLQAAHDVQHGRIDDAVVPGTVSLVDVDHTLQTKHSRAQEDIVLVPTPSEDADDPLNWSPRRKFLAITCMCVYVWCNGMALSVVYSVLVPLSEALEISVGDINAGTGYLFLLAGWGLLLTQPFALQYGKRPTYLISIIGLMAVSLWSPYAKSRGQWIARNIVAGFLCSPIEALPEVSVADLFFAHERGTYMSIYAFTLVGSNYFAPVYCGFVNDSLGYKWVFYLQAIFCGFAFLFLFLFMEETNYDRKTPSVDEAGNIIDRSTSTTNLTSDHMDPSKRKTYLQKLWIKDKPREQRMLYRSLLSLRLVSWPVVFYAGFSYGSYLIYFNILNATASVLLSAPPYNFHPSVVGLAYIACLIGVLAGSIFTGLFGDWATLKLVRRNGGSFEPEMRLWLFSVTTIMLPASMILWGVGAAHQIHWFGLMVAMCTTAFTNGCGVTLSVNYVIDSYRDISGDAMTSVILIRNTMSFAIGYGITPWLDNLGTQNCFISVAFIGLAVCSIFLLVIWKGKALRELYRVKYWNLVRKHVEMGMIH
ncbi:hypothetical protein AMS68_005660 [Peltaster fructicola]|uniref:Major facilitator superfamily (MFS) profile domain-containing protein n=1 Tax=Peltaster fructicola TaxID=286661 RepID=A0A6H0XZG4_9PEZI|nr:hypothetical protein AMS68_005660 [Peltaster fructicola]